MSNIFSEAVLQEAFQSAGGPEHRRPAPEHGPAGARPRSDMPPAVRAGGAARRSREGHRSRRWGDREREDGERGREMMEGEAHFRERGGQKEMMESEGGRVRGVMGGGTSGIYIYICIYIYIDR
jgi:hypothetical protein